MVEEVKQVQESNSKLIWIIVPIVIVTLGVLIFFLTSGSSDVPLADSSDVSSSGVSINILDKFFVLNSAGVPQSIRVVANLETGNCKLAYNDILLPKGNRVFDNEVKIFTEELNNRFDLSLWELCCEFGSLNEFETKSLNTICG